MRSRTCVALGVALLLVGHRTIGGPAAGSAQAGALLAAGRTAEAASAAATCPEPACGLILGRALFAQGKLQEAAAAVERVLPGLGALRPYGEVLMGEALVLAGRHKDALAPLRSAAAGTGPAASRASALLADALLGVGAYGEARAQAEHAASMPGQAPEARAGLAWDVAQAAAASAKDPVLAAEALRSFWLTHPEHPAAETARQMERDLHVTLREPTGRELLLRASKLLAAGHPAASVAQAKAAVSLLSGTDRAEASLLYARALSADGKRSEAAPSLEEAWRQGAAPVASAAGLLLARDRARRGRDPEAIELADQLARKYPGSPEAEEGVLFTARLLIDSGQRNKARARLAKLAARHHGPNPSAARWMLAWLSYEDHLRDAPERFAAFAASGEGDQERAQGLYWQGRSGPTKQARRLYERAADLDPLGWYGLVARERLGAAAGAPPPFPPPRSASALPPALEVAGTLASLGLLPEAAAEADWFVAHHPGDAGAAALPVYQRAARFDRSLVLAESLLGGRGPRAPKLVLDAAYPAAFPADVSRSAQRTRVDPYLLLAVMRRESLFKPDTRSAAGAVGLLQLLPATARRAATVLGRPPLRDDELTVPGTAIDLGAWYLAELLGRFGDPVPALAAYNAGPRIAAPWAIKGAGRPVDEWVEEIPYRETRRYVKIVIGSWSAYRILAGGSSPRLSPAIPAVKSGANF